MLKFWLYRNVWKYSTCDMREQEKRSFEVWLQGLAKPNFHRGCILPSWLMDE